MATATQTDDELIILEDDTTGSSNEEVIDFSETQTAEDIVAEPEAVPKKKLSLGALMGGKKEEATPEVAETLVVEESQDIVNLGESLETTHEASDLFNESAEEVVETSEEPVVDLFAEESPATMFGESEVEQELNLDEVAEVNLEVSETPEVSLLEDNAIEETSEVSLLEESDSAEPEMDLLAETQVAEEATPELSLLEDFSAETTSTETEVSLLEENILEEDNEVSLLEDDSAIFGGDDSSAQGDSQVGDDSAAADDQSMDEILSATIAQLEARKAVVIKDKTTDKDKIKALKAQIKELEHEIADLEESISDMTKEQTKITNNVKSLKAMKLKA